MKCEQCEVVSFPFSSTFDECYHVLPLTPHYSHLFYAPYDKALLISLGLVLLVGYASLLHEEMGPL
jgi:hypothetical protein